MAQVYNKLTIDVNREVTDIITAVQNDAQSRYLDVVLLNGSTAIDLTNHTVKIYGKKADGTEFYNNGEITSATTGRCQFELTSQALAVAQDLQVQIIVYDSLETQILSTQPFKIHVVTSLMSDSSVESSNEYNSLVVLYQNLYEAYNLMTEMVQKIGVPGTVAQGLNLDTMFKVWEWLVTYMQENSTAGVVSAVTSIDSKIGTSADTADTTVFGKLNNGVIKSVQRGLATSISNSYTENTIITISAINPSKAMVIINDRSNMGADTVVVSLSSTELSVLGNIGQSPNANNASAGSFSWQVIEFY